MTRLIFATAPGVEFSFVRSFLTFVLLFYVSGGRAVASSMIYPVGQGTLDSELGRLSLPLPGEVAVMKGGRSACLPFLEK
jgi:hypothetical protein